MHTLICGSIAYDTIMVFKDHFKNHILPEKIHILNVAFLVPDMRREFGGCAGNIAYNLQMIGGSPLIMATVGDDYQPYDYRLQKLNLAQTHIRPVSDTFTAQAFITTDLADNQITAFHPGAMNFSHHNHVTDAKDVSLGILAPDGRDGMLQHAREFHEAGIPFLFDPGQGLPMYNGEELLDFIDKADYIAVNDYEGQLLQERTGKTLEALAKLVQGLVVTRGSEGSIIYADGQQIEIPCVKPEEMLDPTGCGDAYRAGLLYGIANNMDWQTTGSLGSLMGALKIARRGGQNHNFSRDEIGQRYFEAFGNRIL
ncbi:MAG: Adenosine kinase [Nitrosomonadaceae bacterium]|nr:carbohydrate kinase family protein [Nitrosospira sp.]MBI0412794.1 carbohydrate kinase family protein [Nitrosospira sp.]MCG3768895.1 Adenosine kinase [Nitrosomonadaceae bacterium]MSQ44465.1 carbohydrate kinase family protein [Nitrosomonadaceae bacterium]GDX59504.1 sugar kinase [Nitrosomonadaceae bacterium]